MDIPRVLEQLCPEEDWGPCAQTGATYEEFAAKWRGSIPVPTKAAMQAAWDALRQSPEPVTPKSVLRAYIAIPFAGRTATDTKQAVAALAEILAR